MEVIQSLTDCVEVCVRHGIERVILCPGSRNAALIIAFERNSNIQCYSISDERVATFIALGMGMETKQATAIVCTSGTAALNFAPGIAEAFFQEIPLLVLTADRPAEWIDQYDGQTVYQLNAYDKHVKKSYNLLADYANPDTDWFANRVFNEALIELQQAPRGPVHINIPIREPFYPNEGTTTQISERFRVIESMPIVEQLPVDMLTKMAEEISSTQAVWIVVGQQDDKSLNKILQKVRDQINVLVISDVLGNVESDIKTLDNIFATKGVIENPSLLITCGKSIITKRLKLFLRVNKTAKHWHVQQSNSIRDPYQSVTRHINLNPINFFEQLLNQLKSNKIQKDNLDKPVLALDRSIERKINDFLSKIGFCDLLCVATTLKCLPHNSILHLGNSMSVRYANALNFLLDRTVEVQCNRGTSGIEGSLSTAVGQAIATDRQVFCIIGDVSFLYDKNALWHNYIPANLHVIILNNAGGNIFRMIPGPQKQNAYAEFFETRQHFSAEKIAAHFNVAYETVNNTEDLNKVSNILGDKTTTITECFTDAAVNEEVYKALLNIR